MGLSIGSNIKRLRKQNEMTQEDLAGLLNVTSAAVSKWENQDSYPDITTLIPLAEVFGVTLDELMGYALEKEEAEVEKILSKYNSLITLGEFKETAKLIVEAYKVRPNNYQIIRTYMKNIVSNNGIYSKAGELKKLSECILNGCNDEQIRLDALFVKAKLEFEAGRQEEAFKILDGFPTRLQVDIMKKAEILPINSPEKPAYMRKSALSFAETAAMQYTKAMVMDTSQPFEERIKRAEALGDGLTELREKTSETVAAIMEWMTFSHLRLHLIKADADKKTIIRLTGKELAAARAFDEVQASQGLPKFRSLVAMVHNYNKNAQHPEYVKLREDTEYMELLNKFEET